MREKKPIALIHGQEKEPIALIHAREKKHTALIHVREKDIYNVIVMRSVLQDWREVSLVERTGEPFWVSREVKRNKIKFYSN